MNINCTIHKAMAINISTRQHNYPDGREFWCTTISVVDWDASETKIHVMADTLQAALPSIDPYVGTERGSDEHPF